MISTLGRAVELLRQEGISSVRRRVLGRLGGSAEAARRNNYAEWIKRYDRLDAGGREAIARRVAAMAEPPRFSILMPVYNAKLEWLAKAIASVRGQLYPHWELCIADDASTDAQLRAFLEDQAQADSRIKLVFRASNGHISAATNSALELASGDWVALLDQDDLLPAHALFWAADAIVANPALRLIYSDEDKVDERGERYEPYFKCDWNRELFYGQNLFSHLGLFQRELVDQVGGFRVGFEGAQDHDLVLRCIERVDESVIHHIPRVLYHWRAHAGSTAATAESKPYAALAGERALNEHYARSGMRARAEWIGYGYRTHDALPDTLPLVSLVIPTRNGHELVRQCVDSIIGKTTFPNYEILIVDNGSDEPASLAYLASLTADARIRVLRDDGPFNFSALNNRAVAAARGELIGLVNNDIEVRSPDWLSEMVALALRPGVGAVGARLLYPDETLQHGGIIVGIGGVAGHANKHVSAPYRRWFDRTALTGGWSAVTAACLIVTRSAYEAVGGLNEQDLAVAFNDVDFCLRLQEAGYRNIVTPFAELFHHESATRGYEDNPVKRARFRTEIDYMNRRWGSALQRDRAYSPNLTLEHEDFSFAWPPRVASLLESAQ
ncbi:glycosyltransferase family 2 protein [Paraburkholderia sp. J94]|uniref:glycosyltransferase family 2 protein n=1 Tax=Paraburkholderia sp. J94 TaxID=2805441 RepID=UPI0039F05ECD